jgi:hypothetical protein
VAAAIRCANAPSVILSLSPLRAAAASEGEPLAVMVVVAVRAETLGCVICIAL